VDGGEVRERAGWQRAVELSKRAGWREAARALDLRALELASQQRLEAAQRITWQAIVSWVLGR
jgi:hypothetical protein